MLDTYDFRGDVWLCHSFQGQCYDFTAFVCKNHLPSLFCFFLAHTFLTCFFTNNNDQRVPLHKDPNFVINKQEPAIDTLKEIEAFLSANPAEIVTLILEDYVKTPKGLTKVFAKAGLMKFWFPVTRMPKRGGDWPLVSDMIAKNQRLLVFTSVRSKEQSEGIAYQWNYMVENQCKETPNIKTLLFFIM